MQFDENSAFYRALATKYDPDREQEAIEILRDNPDIARASWPGPDDQGQPFVRGATLLHYATNDGKLALMEELVARGADPNASDANWFRSVLAWAANNARLEAIDWLLSQGARADSLDALHAAAWGGSSGGTDPQKDYSRTIERLVQAGADLNETTPRYRSTPLVVAKESGNTAAQETIERLGGQARHAP